MTTIDDDIETIIPLRTDIKSYTLVIKIRSISELPLFIKTVNGEELLFWYSFEFSLHYHELILYQKKTRENIYHNIIVDEYISQISDDDY